MRRVALDSFRWAGLAALLTACSIHEHELTTVLDDVGGAASTVGGTDTAGTQAAGGTSQSAGGVSGGSTSLSGGASNPGGAATSGGIGNIGGASQSGGTSAMGGASTTAGNLGGNPAVGGASPAAGTSSLAGASNANSGGGTPAAGGAPNAGGTPSAGGTPDSGGSSGASAGSSTGPTSTGGTGGEHPIGGSANTGGTLAPVGGAGLTGGATSMGGSLPIGGTTGDSGGTNTAGTQATGGTGGLDSSIGGASSAGGSSGTGGTTSLEPCTTTPDTILTCLPPATFYYENSSSTPERDPSNDPYIGNYQYHVYQDTIQLYGQIAAPGRFWQGSPYTDSACTGKGVDASGKSGLRVTAINNASIPVTLVLHVSDLAGSSPPYPVVKLQALVDVPPGGPTAYDVPFSEFVATCTTTAPFNPALIAQVGLGFASTGTLDLTISSLSFY